MQGTLQIAVHGTLHEKYTLQYAVHDAIMFLGPGSVLAGYTTNCSVSYTACVVYTATILF